MATYNPLSTNFKDDILADSNDRRKYTQINNSDGTISLQDSTAYKQVGSQYGAKEVNEEREAINNIYTNKLVTLDEIDLVTEPGFFVDAQAVKELNSKMPNQILVEFGSLPNASVKSIDANIPDGATNWWIELAWATTPEGTARYPIPYVDVSNWNNSIQVNIDANKQIKIATKADWSGYPAFFIVGYKL